MQGMKWCGLSLAVVLAACGGTESSSTESDATQYEALSHEVASATTSYCDGRSWNGDVTACAAAEAAHEDAVMAHVREMAGLAARLDEAQRQAGRDDHADCACTVGDVQAELDRHRAAACSGSAADREQEAARHCAAMMASAERMHDRARELTHRPDDWTWPRTGAAGATASADGMGHATW